MDRVEDVAAAALGPLRDATALLGAPSALRREFDEQGYAFFPGLLPAAGVETLRSAAVDCCRSAGWAVGGGSGRALRARAARRPGDFRDPSWVALLCRVLTLPSFAALGSHPRILSVLEAIARRPLGRNAGDVFRLVPPAVPELTTPPHQDAHYTGKRQLWTVWIPLGACPTELGGLALLPASHRAGLRHHGEAGINEVPAEGFCTRAYRPGDVLIFDGLTVHRALENRSANTLRLSADYRFTSA